MSTVASRSKCVDAHAQPAGVCYNGRRIRQEFPIRVHCGALHASDSAKASHGLSLIPPHSHENIPCLSGSLMSMAHSESRQALLFDADKESRGDKYDLSSDSIEMSSLDEIPVTPARRDTYGPTRYGSDGNDSDEESDVEDGGDQALLGSRSRSRGRGRTEEHPMDTLSQVKRIVLEVRSPFLPSSPRVFIDICCVRLRLHYF